MTVHSINSSPHTTSSTTSVVVVSGNPRAGSRTLTVADAVAARVRAALDGPVLSHTIELGELGADLVSQHRPRTNGALATLAGANILIVASPVYKASYTGLLKLFLDQLPTNALVGVSAVPVVVSASPAHAFVGDNYLKPLLVDLGASVPTRALAVTESQLPDLADTVDAWWAQAAQPLLRSAANAPK